MQSDSASVKSQLRLTSQRLGQIQAKNDSQATITRTDIATLLQRGDVALAREKAEKLILDEAFGDLVEELEMQLGVLLERFNEFERNVPPSPVMIEAASTIIYASPYVHSKDLDVIRRYLIQRVGHDFARSAMGNRDHHVSPRALKAIQTPIPSAFRLDAYLQQIAEAYNVTWSPEPSPQNNLNSLSELLDLETDHEIDLSLLRRLCLQGIPNEPAWLRPRIWKLFFGVLPVETGKWKDESGKQRTAYYDLVRRLLEPFTKLSPDHSPLDDSLLDVYKHLSGLPKDIYHLLEDEPETVAPSPVHDDAPEEIRISCANALDTRLLFLQSRDSDTPPPQETPEIRLESSSTTPGISLSSLASGSEDLPTKETKTTTLLSSRKSIFGNAHPKHCSSLLRILYLHNALNPGNSSYHTPSILVPLYSVLMQEIELEDLTHAEADIFWLLEAVVAEFSGLEDDDGIASMKSFKERLTWADRDLSLDLESKGLDPGLPHFSYRWLVPLLSHTVPLPSLMLAWDALFSRPARTKGTNPKLEYLVTICTSMLLRAKNHLLRLGTVGQNGQGLWTVGLDYRHQASTIPHQSQDMFLDSLSFLQNYNLELVGGIGRVLQTAMDLHHRREQLAITSQQPSIISIGARLKVNMWRGFGSQSSTSSNDSVSESRGRDSSDYTDGSDTETSKSTNRTSLASSISNTVWRGITNRSAMDDDSPTPPSPSPAPSSPAMTSTNTLDDQGTPNSSASSSIWNYADKIKESDAVATLSKVSTNWGVKSLWGSWSKPATQPSHSHSMSVASQPAPSISRHNTDRHSLPVVESAPMTSPPPRFISPQSSTFHDLHSDSASNSGSILGRTRSILSKSRTPSPKLPKSAPKPLLLSSNSLITANQRHPRSVSDHTDLSSTHDTGEWADVMRTKQQHFHRDSQSSVSSLSPSDAFGRAPMSSRSEQDSDPGSSRRVPLNRRSVSPMAPSFRIGHVRPSSSRASSVSSGIHSPPLLARSPLQESSLMENFPAKSLKDIMDDHTTQSLTSVASTISHPGSAPERETDSSDTTSNEMVSSFVKPLRKHSGSALGSEDTEQSTSQGEGPSRVPKVRTKRFRPANLQIQEPRSRTTGEQKAPSPSNLTVEWPGEDMDNITTPKASSFDSDDHPGRSPRRSRKLSASDLGRVRKSSTDTIVEERPRKISTGHRSRKVSTGSREVQKKQRDSEAEEGDDEGYDELLSAYESEDAPITSSLR
ncbi:hypothetical protein D9613_002985 [Agrocybe pediades]|uniref:Rab-GAP TBC domain-containing protein n=1 Tax=Agrocybe pediades TaxID=84607 RepID=A0A8H4VKV6_9AGAR|nr:hypothetical protein D9613_002985 [Agrocybe pediades]